jgi:hypothetical protein
MDEPTDNPQPPKRRQRKKRKGKLRGVHKAIKGQKQPFKYNAAPVIEQHKATMGRPTDYTVLRGMEILAHMATGLSVTAAAAAMGFAKQTIYAWAERHPDFKDALNNARGCRVLYLERKLMLSVDSASVTAAIFGLKNAEPDEWRDKHEIATRTADDDPLLAFLKSIDGRVMRPVEPPKTLEGVGYTDVTNVPAPPQIDGPPRPIGGAA